MPRGKTSKPRRCKTACAFFVQTCREEHKKRYKDDRGVDFTEFSIKCAEVWKTMSEKEKKRFEEMADRDKKRYELGMQNYILAKKKGRGKKKDPNAPKRSMSAFFWFAKDERSKVEGMNPDYDVGDIAKEIGRLWGEVDPDVRCKYEAMAERDKKRYELEMQNYNFYNPTKKECRGRGKKNPNAPKRFLSAFFLFAKDERSKVKGMNPEYDVGDIAKEIGRLWGEVDPDVRSKYEAMAERDKARYQNELTAYKMKLAAAASAKEVQEAYE